MVGESLKEGEKAGRREERLGKFFSSFDFLIFDGSVCVVETEKRESEAPPLPNIYCSLLLFSTGDI